MSELSEAFFKKMGYTTSRQLEDGTWVALVPLMFTTGICINLDRTGYERRYCFEDKDLCIREYEKLKTVNDVPSGWIAKRPK